MRLRSLLFLLALPLLAAPLSAQILEQVHETYGDRVDFGFPEVDGCEVLVGDFHMHTPHSDGKLPARERLMECYLAGYDTIAITDHGSFAAYDEGKELADELGMVLIRGLESGVNGQEHLVILGVSGDYVPEASHRWSRNAAQAAETGRPAFRDMMMRVKAAGGICFYPHPHHGWTWPIEWGVNQGVVIGFEVLNSETTSGWGSETHLGRPCYPFAFDWALEKDLTILANSDLHGLHTEAQPRGKTLCLVRERSADGVLQALRQGRTLAWFPDGGDKWDSPEMLWAKPGIMADYVAAVTRVEPRELDEGAPCSGTYLQNLGAVPLAAKVLVGGEAVRELVLEQGREYLVHTPGAGAGLSIEWTNLWVSPRDNLVTEYELDEDDDQAEYEPCDGS